MRSARRCQLSLKPKDCMRAVPRKDVRGDDEAFARRFVAGFCSLLWGATFVVVKNALDHASVFIFLAVRFSANGGPKNGGEPRERISLENCIRAYTSGSAYAQFEEGKKGELKQGEYADLSSFRMISPKSPRPVHQNARPPHRRRRPHGVRGSLIRRGRSSVHFLELHSPIFLRAGS